MTAKKDSNITTKNVIAYHWRHALKFPRQVAVSFITLPITIVLERYVTPLIIAALLAAIQAGTVSLESSLWIIVVYGVLQILTQVVGYRVSLHAMWDVQVRGARLIYKQSYNKLTRHSLDFYADNFAGSLVSKVNKFASAFITFWNMVIFEFLFIATSIVATIVGLSFLIWQYALVISIFVILFIIASYYGTRFIRPRQKARSKSYTEISAQLSDSISNMFAVKIDSKEKQERRRLDTSIDSMVKNEFKVRSGVIGVSTVYSVIIALMRISILVISIWAVQQGLANAAIVYLALTYTFNLIQEISKITSVLRTFYQISGDSEEMLSLLEQPIEIKDTSSTKFLPQGGEISLEDVSFSHNNNSELFSALSLTIPAGQKVGVIGVSGSGKTTLTKLLMRFIDPESGHVLIDAQDISQVTQESLHDAIAYVPQEPLLFHRSIAENIGYSSDNAAEESIRSAAKKANALEFIESLPDGFKTLVGERGVKLSGGQRQRIAIARAILKDAPILILDEATSALDSESEKLIQDALEKLMKGRTSIVVAHRLSTIAKLDRIIVLDKGEIIEDGKHADLIEKNGVYAKLWSHQSGGFIED